MKKKKGIFVAALVAAILLIPLVPVVSCESEEDWYEDLIVFNIDTTHNLLNTRHTAWVTIKNIGNYPVNETFTLSLFFECWDTQTGLTVRSLIEEWDIYGLGPPPLNFKIKVYTHPWSNSDPDRYQARFSAFVDSDYEVDESNETNNWGYGEWFV